MLVTKVIACVKKMFDQHQNVKAQATVVNGGVAVGRQYMDACKPVITSGPCPEGPWALWSRKLPCYMSKPI